jgi:hypothetical protein
VNAIARPQLVRGLVIVGGLTLVVLTAYAGAYCVDLASGGALSQSATWGVVTLIVALTVPLVRPRLDRVADRAAERLGGDRYSAVNEFVERIANTLAVDDVLPQVARTATHALRSTRGEVRLWLADGGEWRQTWPPNEDHVDDTLSVSLRHAGMPVGRLAVDVDTAEVGVVERDLLNRLAGPAGLALSNVRLTFELRRRLAETMELAEQVRRSRERLLDAAAVQRRRFAKQVEVRVLRPLDAAEAALHEVATGDAGALQDVRTSAGDALAALRELAAGVFPPTLVDQGVGVALDLHLQANFPMSTLLVDAAVPRCQLSVEATVYFCAVALLADARPDEPTNISVTVTADGEQLELRVRTQTPPSAETAALICDRAEAAGGTAHLEREPMEIIVPTGAGADCSRQ